MTATYTPESNAPTEHERFMQTIDRFIMGVTESLCRLENENVEPEQEEAFRNSKTLILKELDKLEGLMASYRANNSQELFEALASVSGAVRSHRFPPDTV